MALSAERFSQKRKKRHKIRALTSLVNNLEWKRTIGVTPSAASSKLKKKTMKGLNIDIVASRRTPAQKQTRISKDRKLKHE